MFTLCYSLVEAVAVTQKTFTHTHTCSLDIPTQDLPSWLDYWTMDFK